ncbi:MAG: M24 family metallopeptidase [Rikenellaceae bacterium]
MYPKCEEQELSLRWAKVKRVMTQSGVEAMIVSDNTSLIYLSGRIFSGVVLLLADEEQPLFFVRRPVGLEGERVIYMRKVEDIPQSLQDLGIKLPNSIAIEGDAASYNEYMRLKGVFKISPDKIYPTATAIMRYARSVKTPYEIEQFKISAALHSKLYSMVPEIFQPGMTDHQLAIELEYRALCMGKKGSMRIFGNTMESHVGSILVGDNADSPSPFDFALGGAGFDRITPVGSNGSIITEGVTVMVDGGGNFTNYVTDMTRVFALGTLPDIAYRAHQTALEMQEMLMQDAKAGRPTAQIYENCIQIARRESLSEYFMGHKQQAGFVGHGVGLEINESPVLAPRSREHFEVGNVIAFEPKFVIPEIGAVGIENTFVCTEGGKLEKITIFEEEIIAL